MNNYYSLTLMNKYINYIHKLFILIKNMITKYSNKIKNHIKILIFYCFHINLNKEGRGNSH